MDCSAKFYESVIEPVEDRMIRAIWRIAGNGQDAEDAMQNALVAIWKGRQRIERHPSPQALVLRICIDAACDVMRRRTRLARKTVPQDDVEPLPDRALSPWERLAQQELSREILAAIHRLSRAQAIAITLRVFEDLPYDQIAAALGCAEATARKHVERARGRLRVVLAKHRSDHLTRS
jgi:RNA polymerase sigma-70 factor (ECF subfamily)